ncbi:PP2C family protein-serine/threonine phosphatase [Actinacidiphila paucisporea]|uniref:Serine phosphatase RsbU, regulator of sigma subunit n=1 Tax=Actinacidiphila paucisporea TaxID=310782 RepID=A0A1M7LSA9_9ACTN|nr:PP2C family protein-serine/threonine phosphatase [Actinacidiphila paucisporea]SHM81097.1 Serine phosphatase RsbU, regulator of sigma subunit [Actinacidiphila paucisporea]
MTSAHHGLEGVLADLLRVSHRATFEQLPGMMEDTAARSGFSGARLFVVDLQQDVLREVTGRGLNAGEGGQELRIDTTLAGRSYQSTQTLASGDGQDLWAPVLDGTERLGVLGLHRDSGGCGETDRGAQDRVAAGEALASMVGLLLVSKRSNSDSYARLARTREMRVSAEMQWTLMPPMAFANDRVTISAAMEPAYQVAGDGFDYAVAGDTAHLAIFDAMGHDTAAGLTASLAMATSRNQRRQGAGIAEASQAIEQMLVGQFGHTRYATGILADLDLNTGLLTWVNRGHHLPVIIRGGRWATSTHCPPAGPMGAALGLPVTVCHDQLEPGDRLLLHTDGITEARGHDGTEFGLERFTDYVVRHHAGGLPVSEMLRRLIHALLDYHEGRLEDDATVLFCQWNGPA